METLEVRKGTSGWVFLIAGLIVLIASWIIDKDKLLLFIILSGIIALYGAIKIFFNYMGSRDKKHKQQNHQRPHQTASHNQHSTSGHGQQQHASPHHQNLKHCPSCGTRIHATFSFCPKCGARV